MAKGYADVVRLLLAIAPDVFANDFFAMKGGTALNLFVRDMPRLSVDIDVVYTPWQDSREQALSAITTELDAISARVAKLGLTTRKVAGPELGETKLLVLRSMSYTAANWSRRWIVSIHAICSMYRRCSTLKD